jgi:hypothetical protein
VTDNFNQQHPELREGENWVGNFTRAKFERLAFGTKRLGVETYLPDGSRLSDNTGSARMYPVFVEHTEYLERRSRNPMNAEILRLISK